MAERSRGSLSDWSRAPRRSASRTRTEQRRESWLQHDYRQHEVDVIESEILNAEFDERFGKGNWRIVWAAGSEILNWEQMASMYEDAYFKFLSDAPGLLAQLSATILDVYEDSISNTASGLDYSRQEFQHAMTSPTSSSDAACCAWAANFAVRGCFSWRRRIPIRYALHYRAAWSPSTSQGSLFNPNFEDGGALAASRASISQTSSLKSSRQRSDPGDRCPALSADTVCRTTSDKTPWNSLIPQDDGWRAIVSVAAGLRMALPAPLRFGSRRSNGLARAMVSPD